MSDSRLEKFIYAICSMDVSDLPVPLSRIEKLWNCLITGETPDFEPLSRNEKYLMVMLDRYDISNLPAPMSRGEKLLYKIAVGETDLSDVPGYLSRYEELLKYLIENGGISEGDFEYVLYTLNQSLYTLYTTAEKPVKSAILKGNTLVNINRPVTKNNNMRVENGLQILTTWTAAYNLWMVNDITLFKTNTKYYIIVEVVNNTLTSTWNPMFGSNDCVFSGNITSLNFTSGETGIKCATFTTKSDFKNVVCGLRSATGTNETVGSILKFRVAIIEYQDGMENWDIPYFEGMQSVKMPVLKTVGKNLFDLELVQGAHNYGEVGKKPNFNMSISRVTNVTDNYIKINPNTKITFSISNDIVFSIAELDINGYGLGDTGWVGHTSIKSSHTITTKEKTSYIGFNFRKLDNSIITTQEVLDSNPMFEISDTATTYEPFKSNILTVNEDVTLRGIGDVQDELDCLTGEVTESIGEIVLDGTQYMDADGRGIYIQVDDMKKVDDYRTIITCDKLPVFYQQWDLLNVENGISGYRDEENIYPGQNWLYIKVNNSIDVGEVRQILTQNPITVQYGLSVESIKTVNLTVVDQDNQPTELGTFENVTHVSLVAENLIPEVEMEVATDISEELASASPLMDDISTEQQQLEATIDEQSNNVDATMIATTEIYEETL